MFWIILVLIIVIGIYLYIQNRFIHVVPYRVTIPNLPQSLKGKKIVHISDVHLKASLNTGFIKSMLGKVEAQDPDLIVVTGDLIHANVDNLEDTLLLEVCESLNAIADTYIVTGNHDIGNPAFDEFTTIVNETGVNLLVDDAQIVRFDKDDKEAALTIMGLAERADMEKLSTPYLKNIELTEEMKEYPKILLAHHPEYFEDYLVDKEKAPDLTFAGHTHGGMLRLPYFGGLYGPGQDFFPKYDYGLFISENDETKRMILTKGVGNSTFPLRLNNRTEIITVVLN